MESARSTGSFNRKITVADSNNIIAILDMNAANSKYQIFEQDYLVEFQAVLEDLKVTVGLMSLAEAPWPDTNALMSESATMAEIAKIRTQGQKISLGLYTATGNGPWQYESEVVLQNQGGSETHVPILVPFLSSNETLLMAGNFKLGVKIEPKWNQPLKANDYLIVKGTWRQIVSFSKKKDDGIEALTARIAALELAVQDRLIDLPAGTLLGRNGTTGTVQQIPQSQFDIPATIQGVRTFSNTTASTSTTTGALIVGGGIGADHIKVKNAWLLEARTGQVAQDLNAQAYGQFAATRWFDGAATNTNAPIGSGMLLQFDPFFGSGDTSKYRVQEFMAGNQWWKRIEYNNSWGIWYELAFLNKAQTFTSIQNFITQININTTKVLGVRNTGWTPATGTPNKAAFAADTATLIQVAQRLLALEQALIGHGLIGA